LVAGFLIGAEVTENLAFAFDLETTSAEPESTTPVQICLMSQDAAGARRVLLNHLVRPFELISDDASKIHGITNEMVASAADAAIVAYTVRLLYDGLQPEYLVTFNGKTFDEPIIDRCLGGKCFPGVKHIDVLDTVYRYWQNLPGYRLGLLYEQFVGKSLVGAHDATIDVGATLDLLAAVCKLVSKDFATVHAEMSVPTPYKVMPLGKHKGKPIDEIPSGWAKWMRQNATGMRPDLAATVTWIMEHNR
jgi:exodeoxyribonuclease X